MHLIFDVVGIGAIGRMVLLSRHFQKSNQSSLPQSYQAFARNYMFPFRQTSNACSCIRSNPLNSRLNHLEGFRVSCCCLLTPCFWSWPVEFSDSYFYVRSVPLHKNAFSGSSTNGARKQTRPQTEFSIFKRRGVK